MQHAEQLSPNLLFPVAFDRWIEKMVIAKLGHTTDAHYISERTEYDYRQYAAALEKMFYTLQLDEIHDGHIREYHRARAFCDGAWKHPCGAKRIRQEVGMLLRILVEAGAWTDRQNREFARLRPVESDVPRAMDQDEQNRWLRTAASREDWHLIHMYSIAALQTTAATNEMRGLKIGDVALHQGIVQIRERSAKNRFRVRSIPIETEECRWAFEALVYRAYNLGCKGPHHYLLPFRVSPVLYDPAQPMSESGLKKKWEEVRTASGLEWLRPYDLRHSAITRMAENGVPIPIILSFAGHISQRMQQHYTQISMMAKRKAAASTWSQSNPFVTVSNHARQHFHAMPQKIS